MLAQRAKQISMVYAAAQGHTNGNGPFGIWQSCLCMRIYCNWEPYSWSLQSLKMMWKFMILASTDCKEQRGHFGSDSRNWRCTVEKERHERLLWQQSPSHPQKVTAKTRSHWREFLETLIELKADKLLVQGQPGLRNKFYGSQDYTE